MKKKSKRNDDLFPWAKSIAIKCGFELLNRGKPYYVNDNETKVFRVVKGCKLREMSDGATPTRYGRLKLKQLDGTFRDEYTHRVICEHYNKNPDNKSQVHHITGDKSRNAPKDLAWSTAKENAQYREADKRKKKAQQKLRSTKSEVTTNE